MNIQKRIAITVIPLLAIALAAYIVMHASPQLAIRARIFAQTVFAFESRWQPFVAFDSDHRFENTPESPHLFKVTLAGEEGHSLYSVERPGLLFFAQQE